MRRLGRPRALAILCGLVVVSISVAASLGFGKGFLVALDRVPGGDMLGHFLLVGGLSLVSTLAFVDRRSARSRRDWYQVMGVLAALLTLDELLQAYLPLRSFSLSDLGADYLGIVLFSTLGWFLVRRQRRSVVCSP